MSIIMALAYKDQGYLATDSQKTNLTTLEPSFGYTKAMQICEGLVAGYGGISELCEDIMKEAIQIHRALKRGNMTSDFILSLKAGLQIAELKYGVDVFDKFVVNFLIVGQGTPITPAISMLGTQTRFKEVIVDRDDIHYQAAFLPPDDVSYQECLNIASQTITAAMDHNPETLCNAIIQEISQRSQYCGGEPKILKV